MVTAQDGAGNGRAHPQASEAGARDRSQPPVPTLIWPCRPSQISFSITTTGWWRKRTAGKQPVLRSFHQEKKKLEILPYYFSISQRLQGVKLFHQPAARWREAFPLPKAARGNARGTPVPPAFQKRLQGPCPSGPPQNGDGRGPRRRPPEPQAHVLPSGVFLAAPRQTPKPCPRFPRAAQRPHAPPGSCAAPPGSPPGPVCPGRSNEEKEVGIICMEEDIFKELKTKQ